MKLQEFLDRLPSYRKSGERRYLAPCPAHDDTSPSLSIAEGQDGRILIHCYAGCGACDVVQSVGLELSDLFPETNRNFPPLSRPKGDTVDDYVVTIFDAYKVTKKKVTRADKARYRQARKRGERQNNFIDEMLEALS